MLEFQEGFFEQEVRDGFYLDTTMKTVWAAELEVLQKVAEVCDRHGLKWYAAYGTLLGAIRHEGFVPWDDDMDIWVKRPDYNKLMQILPKELPEGYRVRSPLTEEGYDQYHTCLNSGSGISIAKDWLDQFHGCPFTVGLDIFPLDYLPRDEKERELQCRLVTMTARIAQLAKNLARGDYDSEEEPGQGGGSADGQGETAGVKRKTAKDNVIEEINLGISYLEGNCRLQIDHLLIEKEDWYQLSSELWKWANYLTMMYGEEESDYLVEYLDYIQCPHKTYPKEWLADGYSATYENFMIPIPAGYEEILRYIYGLDGNYLVRVKKTGRHEYPYYARQLRQLREYVKDIQHRAQDAGLVSIDDIDVKEETKELLPEWIPLAIKEDGSRKKAVLSANDLAVFAACGDRALDKLEETLRIFEQAKDSVLLWWRPQPLMRKVLEEVSPQLGERYQKILDSYREGGWGVCDETDNIDRAVEACDAYYGDMNAVLQPFQDMGKPIMLSVSDGREAWKENAERINEYRAFFSMSDYVEDGERIYFANTNYNALILADKGTGRIVQRIPLPGCRADRKNMHLQCARLQNKIYFLPAEAQCVHIYDMESGEQKVCHFLEEEGADTPRDAWSYFLREDSIYFLPCRGRQGLWSMTVQEDGPVREDWWEVPTVNDSLHLRHGRMDGDRFYSFEVNCDRLYLTNVAERAVKSVQLPDKYIEQVAYDGQNFWYTFRDMTDIVCWNEERGVVDRYQVSCEHYRMYGSFCRKETYRGICFAGGNLFLFSWDCRILYVLDRETRELRTLHNIECARGAFDAADMVPYFKRRGNKLIYMLQNAGEILVIDLETLEVRQEREVFHADSPMKEEVYEQSYRVLMDRKALLYEEAETAGLDLLIRYCMEE